MKNEIIRYLDSKETQNHTFNNIIRSKKAAVSEFDALPLLTSKYCLSEELTERFDFQSTYKQKKQQFVLKQQEGAGKRNIFTLYNGMIVSCQSYVKGVEIMRIEEGMKRYPFLIDQYMKKKKRNRKLSQLDILASTSLQSGFFIYVHDTALQQISEETTIYIYSSISEADVIDSGYSLCIIGKNNTVKIVREQIPIPFEGEALVNRYEDIFVDEESILNYISIGTGTDNIYNFGTKDIYLASNAQCKYMDFLINGKMLSQNLNMYLEGDNSNGYIHGVAYPVGTQRFETYSLINNIGRGTQGKVLYKNIVANQTKLLFDGLIKIEKTGEQTNSYLEDHTIVCGNEAKVESIPGLEIEANEVKASHGATVGGIDSEELFYAQSRGLSLSEARSLILTGFIKPIIDELADNDIQDRILSYFSTKLQHAI